MFDPTFKKSRFSEEAQSPSVQSTTGSTLKPGLRRVQKQIEQAHVFSKHIAKSLKPARPVSNETALAIGAGSLFLGYALGLGRLKWLGTSAQQVARSLGSIAWIYASRALVDKVKKTEKQS